MKAYVYHFDAEKVCPDHPMAFLTGEGPVFPTDYRLVAYVDTDAPPALALMDAAAGNEPDRHKTAADWAFEKTNHIDDDWRAGDGLVPVGNPQRSTSVGDVIFVQDDDDDDKEVETGHYYLCKAVGWQEIDAPLYPLDVATYPVDPPYYPDKSDMDREVTIVHVSMIGPDAFDFFDQDDEHLPPTFYGANPTMEEIRNFLQQTE